MKDWAFKEPVHFHGKGFSLEWDFPEAWLILLHYRNGESKPWYRRTERSYRFRRWFLKKGKDRFQNLANFRNPFLTLYIFSGVFPVPRKITIPMDVRILRVNEPEARTLLPADGPKFPEPQAHSPVCRENTPSVQTRMPLLQIVPLEAGQPIKFPEIQLDSPPVAAGFLQNDFEQFKINYPIPVNS